jgi:hypothetical protein
MSFLPAESWLLSPFVEETLELGDRGRHAGFREAMIAVLRASESLKYRKGHPGTMKY